MDTTATDRAVLVGLSAGATWGLKLAADHPDRVAGVVFIGTGVPSQPLAEERAEATRHFFDPAPANPHGWQRLNAEYWSQHFDDFAEFFFGQCFNEPHSTKLHEDCVGWSLETTPDAIGAGAVSTAGTGAEQVRGWAERMTAPSLVIHGDQDAISPLECGRALAEQTHGDLVVLEGAGHIPLTA